MLGLAGAPGHRPELRNWEHGLLAIRQLVVVGGDWTAAARPTKQNRPLVGRARSIQ